MEDIIEKFGDLSVSEKPKVPKGKRTAYAMFMQHISADMKKRGFKFFGSTICYAHMQATGMVNDHVADCSFK